jgi:hypothetical protein
LVVEEVDHAALASLDRKLQMLKDRVVGVARGLHTGLFVFGEGGCGKSFTVLTCLDGLRETAGTSYKLFNSRVTGKGLFVALSNAADAVHVIEDTERLTRDRDGQGVLRSALWCQPGHERVVTWVTATGGEEHFTFRGAVILIGNRPLADLPELRALATRITVYRLEVTEAEAVAQVRAIAAQGFKRDGKTLIEPEPCQEVAEHVIRECRAAACPPDLRLLPNACADFLLWESGYASCHWKDLVTSRVREAAHHFLHEPDAETREARLARHRAVVLAIVRQTQDTETQVRLYREQTGMSRASFFRRKREVESGEFDGEDPD